MNVVLVKPWSRDMAASLADFPYYVLHLLARRGPGCVWAEKSSDEFTPWQYASRRTDVRLEMARLPTGMFRPVLSRFTALAGLDTLGGHALFAVEPPRDWPHAGLHRFSLFLCNYGPKDAWLRLYLYRIDGVWPEPAAGAT